MAKSDAKQPPPARRSAPRSLEVKAAPTPELDELAPPPPAFFDADRLPDVPRAHALLARAHGAVAELKVRLPRAGERRCTALRSPDEPEDEHRCVLPHGHDGKHLSPASATKLGVQS